VDVFVIGDALFDVAFETVNGEIHLAELEGLIHLLLAVDGKLADALVVILDEAALLAFRHGELAEEVFVDAAEGVALDGESVGGETLQKGDQDGFVEAVVGAGENVFEGLVLGFDGLHGVVDGLADVGAFGQVEERGEAGFVGEIENALGLVVGFGDGAAAGFLGGQPGFGLGESEIGVAEEDQAEDGDGVFGGFELRVGAEFVGGAPEGLFEVGVVSGHGWGSRPSGDHSTRCVEEVSVQSGNE
jgi:hypothetical protein